jgi:hypothetical protein
MKRRGIAIILSAALMLSLLGCGGGNSSSSTVSASGGASKATSSQAMSKAESKASAQDSGKLGNYTAVIESARLSKDYEDKKVMLVKYKFTNNSDKSISFASALIGKAFQDGVQLENAVVDSSTDKKYNIDNYMKEIKKGASLEVECPYKLSNTKSKVEVELTEIISMSDEKLTKTFDISKLK